MKIKLIPIVHKKFIIDVTTHEFNHFIDEVILSEKTDINTRLHVTCTRIFHKFITETSLRQPIHYLRL